MEALWDLSIVRGELVLMAYKGVRRSMFYSKWQDLQIIDKRAILSCFGGRAFGMKVENMMFWLGMEAKIKPMAILSVAKPTHP